MKYFKTNFLSAFFHFLQVFTTISKKFRLIFYFNSSYSSFPYVVRELWIIQSIVHLGYGVSSMSLSLSLGLFVFCLLIFCDQPYLIIFFSSWFLSWTKNANFFFSNLNMKKYAEEIWQKWTKNVGNWQCKMRNKYCINRQIL